MYTEFSFSVIEELGVGVLAITAPPSVHPTVLQEVSVTALVYPVVRHGVVLSLPKWSNSPRLGGNTPLTSPTYDSSPNLTRLLRQHIGVLLAVESFGKLWKILQGPQHPVDQSCFSSLFP